MVHHKGLNFFILLYEIRAAYLATYFYFFVQISIWRGKFQKQQVET